MDKLKYIFWVSFVLFLILTTHIGYQYIAYVSPKTPGKGGTFVEATFADVSYIPYLWSNTQDTYYQSFFFDPCIKTQFSGSKVDYIDALCKVNTNDFKVFTLKLNQQKLRSDQTPVTLDDIERTYSSLLINNLRNISNFDTYKSIDIRRKWQSLTLTFPTASYDNFAFFTNFVLPSHILSKQDLNYYKTVFVKNPTVSQCARIEPSTSDTKSLLINTQACSDVYFNYYQIKKFENSQSLQTYIQQGNTNTIDLYIDPLQISGYTAHRLLTSVYPTLFFNIKSDRLPTHNRIYIAHLLHHTLFGDNLLFNNKNSEYTGTSITWSHITWSNQQTFSGQIVWEDPIIDTGTDLWSLIQNDRFLFDYFPPLSGVTFTRVTSQTTPASGTKDTISSTLPSSIYIKGSGKKFFYQLGAIKDRVELSMRFDVAYEKVGISANNGPEYVPESYQATGKKLQYNIATKYGNIKPWYNTYIVRWYASGNIPFKIATISITYKPTTSPSSAQTSSPSSTLPKIRLFYEDTSLNQNIISRIQKIMSANTLQDAIEYYATWVDSLDKIVQSREYDIILKNVNLGIKKDISWFFSTDDPMINPSLYQNSELSSFISQYFVANKKIKSIVKQGIDDIYTKDIPFLALGKLYQTLRIKNNIQIQASDRLYDASARKDFLSSIYFADTFDIQASKILNFNNLRNFIKISLSGQ